MTWFSSHWKQIRRIAGLFLTIAILFFLGDLLYRTWGDLAQSGFHFEFDLPRLIISLALLVIARGFAVEAWRRILISLGDRIGFAFSARVWFLSNLTRYVPGNVWQVATMMAMVVDKGVSKTNALLSQVIYTALALSIAGLLGLMFIFVRPEILNHVLSASISAYAPVIASLAFVALIIIFALPPVNRFIVALTARVTRRNITAPVPSFTHGLVPPMFSLAMWTTNGVAFYLFTSSVTETSAAQIPAYIMMNAGAYWIGYMSFVTPSGLGFREGALAWMLASFFPAPFAVALSLITRLWSTAGEILGVVLALNIGKSND